MNNWTPDRPTKPGNYKLSLHPGHRKGLPHCLVAAVVPMPEWLCDTEADKEQLVVRCETAHGALFVTLDNERLVGALWRPYVEPPDPFAEPMPKPSEFKAYRLSDDAKTPNLRLILDVEPGMVTLYEADMTSRSPDAQETEMHDKIMMSQADARWLRDTLNNADLSDPPGWDR